MSTIWLIKLLLSHLLTDFVLQKKEWIRDRTEKHFSSLYLYLHTGITAIIALLFIGFSYWYFALIIFITHIIIDGWKSYRPQTVKYFLIDQFLHLLVIGVCWYLAFYSLDDLKQLLEQTGKNYDFWVITTAFLFLSLLSGILIGELTVR